MKFGLPLFLLLSILFLSACDIAKNKVEPDASFFKIYENGDFDKAYEPLDIKQTADSGFVILGTTPTDNSSFFAVYLMKTGNDGSFQWQHTAPELVNPVSELLPSGNDFVFFCMNRDNHGPLTRLVKAAQTPQVVSEIGAEYPLSAGLAGSGFLLQTYDRFNRQTVVYPVSPEGNTGQAAKFDIFEDVEATINSQLTRQNRSLPFFVGATPSGQYFFNGYNNFTLSMTFFNPGDSKQTGILNGERYGGAAMSNALATPDGKFAISRYLGNGETVFIPKATLSATAIAASKDLKGNVLPELSSFARVLIKRAKIGEKDVLLYGADTKNGQIVIFAYDEASGNLLGSRYLGSGNRFEMGNFTLTREGGMAIAGKTFVVGRFPRICLFKLTPDEVNDLVSQVVK
jgi:hypothetical protein